MNILDIFNAGLANTTMAKILDKYQRLEIEICYLTGHGLEDLRDLFAKGYTLTPPRYTEAIEDFIRWATEEDCGNPTDDDLNCEPLTAADGGDCD